MDCKKSRGLKGKVEQVLLLETKTLEKPKANQYLEQFLILALLQSCTNIRNLQVYRSNACTSKLTTFLTMFNQQKLFECICWHCFRF